MSYALTKNFVASVPVSIFFHCHSVSPRWPLLIFSPAATMKFPCCLSLFCFISRSSSFSVFYVSVDTEISSKKHSAVLLFFLLNVLGAIRFFTQTRGFVITKFHSGLPWGGHTYIRTDGRTWRTDGRDYQRARELSWKGSYGDFSDRYYGVKNTNKITSFLSIFVRFSAFLASFSSAVVFSTTRRN